MMKFDFSFTRAPFTGFCDWYQLTQLQALTHQLNHDGGVRIRMKYTVRTKDGHTARLRGALREALDSFEDRHVLLPGEIPYVRAVRYMKPVFVDQLRDLRLHPSDHVQIGEQSGELHLVIDGGI